MGIEDFSSPAIDCAIILSFHAQSKNRCAEKFTKPLLSRSRALNIDCVYEPIHEIAYSSIHFYTPRKLCREYTVFTLSVRPSVCNVLFP